MPAHIGLHAFAQASRLTKRSADPSKSYAETAIAVAATPRGEVSVAARGCQGRFAASLAALAPKRVTPSLHYPCLAANRVAVEEWFRFCSPRVQAIRQSRSSAQRSQAEDTAAINEGATEAGCAAKPFVPRLGSSPRGQPRPTPLYQTHAGTNTTPA
jgi:hypothetical protein